MTATDFQVRTHNAHMPSKSMGTRGSAPEARARRWVWVRVVTGSFTLTHGTWQRTKPLFTGSTHVFEQGSNVGCHQQYSRALRRCQLPCHGSSSQVGLGRARRRSEVEKRGDGEGGGGVNKHKPASVFSKLLTRLGMCQRRQS